MSEHPHAIHISQIEPRDLVKLYTRSIMDAERSRNSMCPLDALAESVIKCMALRAEIVNRLGEKFNRDRDDLLQNTMRLMVEARGDEAESLQADADEIADTLVAQMTGPALP